MARRRAYDDWRANFGAAAPGNGSSAAGAVPEPTTLVMVLGALLLAGAGCRRRG